ncbi:hypothetical protein ANCCEY_13642 [Ancylostoma ceylanicum]|uniref:Uncharacterized protein n=1 Tax=Ancylostoma ceylanicum TaxID=53326 RepID=A0A0D6LI47_9BILA|nr:hypothetical protein ANCCEY_13642 [Ancylostoma ceylanicum]
MQLIKHSQRKNEVEAQPIFAAYCQPVINPENAETLSSGNTDVFTSQHYLDMTFKEVDHM